MPFNLIGGRRVGRTLNAVQHAALTIALKRNKTLAYATNHVSYAFEMFSNLYPHLILKKFDGYVSVKFPACEK